MKIKRDYEGFAIIPLELKNYEDEVERLDEVIIDTGYDDQLIVNFNTFNKLRLNRWRSPWGEEMMRRDPLIIYGKGKINIPGLFSGYWDIDVATYPDDRNLRDVNLLGMIILDKIYTVFNALIKPKKLTLCTE